MVAQQTQIKTDNATMIEVEGQIHITGMHQIVHPHLEGSMAFQLNEVDMLSCEAVSKAAIGSLDFKLFHMKDNTNGMDDLLDATDLVNGSDEDVVSAFCDVVREYDTLGLSDVANAVVFIEDFEITTPTARTNSLALGVFMEQLEFLSADFVVAKPKIADFNNMTAEETNLVHTYREHGFRPYKGELASPLFIQSNLLSLHVEDEL